MTNKIYVPLIFLCLSACSSLENKSSSLQVGAPRSEVARSMGAPPYKFTHENVDAWRYAVVAGFGYCDYREFYIYKDVLIYKNEYHRASIAGCTAGLRNIDWEPVFAAAEIYDEKHPNKEENPTNKNIVEQLKELNQLKESGALTEAEYGQAKSALLND